MTIIEVLASLAAFAAVSALLLPALSDARRQSKEIRCLGNLKSIAGASLIHAAADPSEFAIPAHPLIGNDPQVLGEYEWGGKSGIGEPAVGTDRLSSKWGTLHGRGPATRPLNEILYGDVLRDHQFDAGTYGANWLRDTKLELDDFHCPADYGYTGHHYTAWRNSKLTSYDHYGNSYTANAAWIGIPGSNCKLKSNSSFLKPISRVPAPAQTLLYTENCGRFGHRANYGVDGCQSLSGALGIDVQTDVRGWHGQMWMFQVAFVDGHAGLVRMQGHQQPQPFLGRYPGDGDDPAQQHYYWHCVIFRGPGWQLDTLPSPPVPTALPCGVLGVLHGIG
ncbi:MAG: hypothetical protein HOP29_07570 [Phycisphaerales bacterium]|nr:hypothetical protein [Phycisphaerales bacterium]